MPTATNYPSTPTLDRMLAIKDRTQVLGEFLEWLHTKDIFLARLARSAQRGRLVVYTGSIEELLAKFHEIDLKAAEQERRAILAYVRRQP